MILHLCLVFLKWGSGKRKNILLSWKRENGQKLFYSTLDQDPNLCILIYFDNMAPKCGPHDSLWLAFENREVQNWNFPPCVQAPLILVWLIDYNSFQKLFLLVKINNVRYRQRDVVRITWDCCSLRGHFSEDGKTSTLMFGLQNILRIRKRRVRENQIFRICRFSI